MFKKITLLSEIKNMFKIFRKVFHKNTTKTHRYYIHHTESHFTEEITLTLTQSKFGTKSYQITSTKSDRCLKNPPDVCQKDLDLWISPP